MFFQSVVGRAHFNRKHLDQGYSQLCFVLDLFARHTLRTNQPDPLPHVVSAKDVARKSVLANILGAGVGVGVHVLQRHTTNDGIILAPEEAGSLEVAVIVVWNGAITSTGQMKRFTGQIGGGVCS